MARHGQTLKQGVGEGLGQFGLGGGAAGLAEVAQVHIVGFGQTQQQLGRNRALIALDMVQIRGRDAQIARHRRLRQAEVAPQPFQAAAEEEFAISGGVHDAMMSRYD
ncbi:hypothetical protein D3C81_1833950 [compost metagenome]